VLLLSLHPSPTRKLSLISMISFGECASATASSTLSPSLTSTQSPAVTTLWITSAIPTVSFGSSVSTAAPASTRLPSTPTTERSSPFLLPTCSSTASTSCLSDPAMHRASVYTAMMRIFQTEWDALFAERHPESTGTVGSKNIIDDTLLWCTDKCTVLLYFRCVCEIFQRYRVSLVRLFQISGRVDRSRPSMGNNSPAAFKINSPAASKFNVLHDPSSTSFTIGSFFCPREVDIGRTHKTPKGNAAAKFATNVSTLVAVLCCCVKAFWV
jgi:hypothetical protein